LSKTNKVYVFYRITNPSLPLQQFLDFFIETRSCRLLLKTKIWATKFILLGLKQPLYTSI